MSAEPTLSAERLREFFHLSMAISPDLSLSAVLQRTITAACALTGARYGALGIIEDGAIQELVLEGAHLEWIEQMPHPPQGKGLIGFLLDHPEPLIVNDITSHPASVGFPEGHPPMRTLLGVPVTIRGELFATIYLSEKRDGTLFTEADAHLVTAFVAAAGVAIQNARHHEEHEEILLVQERERIARDLHDRVIQRLFATAMSLEAAARNAEDDRSHSALSRAVDDLDDTIREIRSTIFELHHTASTVLSRDVAELVEELVPILGFAPIVLTEGPLDSTVAEPVRAHFLATLRELLTNVSKHARASSVHVTIRVNDHLSVRVADDGQGIETLDLGANSRGMANLRSRAETLNGNFTISRNGDRGTIAEWVVPLQA